MEKDRIVKLESCPQTPNCVSSQADDPRQFVEPLSYTGNQQSCMQKLLSILHEFPRTTVVSHDDVYIRAQCRSRLFRFIDDIEFLYDEEQQLCHVRSASRKGRYDFGVNRKRVENIRKLLNHN